MVHSCCGDRCCGPQSLWRETLWRQMLWRWCLTFSWVFCSVQSLMLQSEEPVAREFGVSDQQIEVTQSWCALLTTTIGSMSIASLPFITYYQSVSRSHTINDREQHKHLPSRTKSPETCLNQRWRVGHQHD